MKNLKEELVDEIRKRNDDLKEEKIKKLSEAIEEEVGKTTFINRLSSPATIIAAIVGYSIGGQLPDDALVQIAVGILSAATTEHIISSFENETTTENKYREDDLKIAYRDVDRIYSIAQNTLSNNEQREKRMKAAAYRAMMRNPRTRMLIV